MRITFRSSLKHNYFQVMDPEKKPHPNCGVPMEEVNFMQNIISGEFPGDSKP